MKELRDLLELQTEIYKKKEFYRALLLWSKSISHEDNHFINNCIDYYKKNGLLTEKQIKALLKTKPVKWTSDSEFKLFCLKNSMSKLELS
jgi:hypothetical protein